VDPRNGVAREAKEAGGINGIKMFLNHLILLTFVRPCRVTALQETRLLVAKATWSSYMVYDDASCNLSLAFKGKATATVDRWFEANGARLIGGEVLMALLGELREVMPDCRDKLDEMVGLPALTPQVPHTTLETLFDARSFLTGHCQLCNFGRHQGGGWCVTSRDHRCADCWMLQASEIRKLAQSAAAPAGTTGVAAGPSPAARRRKPRVKAGSLNVCRGCGPLFEMVEHLIALEKGAKLAKRKEVTSTLRSEAQLKQDLSRGAQGETGHVIERVWAEVSS
jgi:hypothetical protein